MVPTRLCVLAAPTFLWMTSSQLQPKIWSMISGRNLMMIVRRGAQIQDVSRQRKQASKSLNGSFNRALSNSCDTLKSSETVLLVSLPRTSKALLLMRMWLGCVSTITLWILPLQALWPIGSIQAAAQLQISRCEDGIHWLDGCLRICVVGGYLSGTLEGGRMGDNLEFFGEVLGLFLVFCLFYYYIIHIHAWRAVLRVHNVGINRWDDHFWEWHSGSDRTPCTAIMWLVVWYLYPAEVSPNDWWNANAFQLVAITIFVKVSQSTTLQHACHLAFSVPSCCPSKELEVWVPGQDKILESSRGWKDASRWCF